MLLGFLLVLLSLGPLPDLPSIPSGSEIRIISPDLRTVYKVWKVEDRKMLEQGTPEYRRAMDIVLASGATTDDIEDLDRQRQRNRPAILN